MHLKIRPKAHDITLHERMPTPCAEAKKGFLSDRAMDLLGLRAVTPLPVSPAKTIGFVYFKRRSHIWEPLHPSIFAELPEAIDKQNLRVVSLAQRDLSLKVCLPIRQTRRAPLARITLAGRL